ncbi:MAG: DUF2232 domain-containing protein, partial [Alphaproteobacteria bacterium]
GPPALAGAALGRVVALMAYSVGLLALAGAIGLDQAFAHKGGVTGLMKELVATLAEALARPGISADEAARQRAALATLAPGLPLAMTAGLLLLHIANAAAATVLGGQRQDADKPRFSSLWLPRWLVVPLVGCAGLSLLLSGRLGLYGGIATAALGAAALLQGLAVLHVRTQERAWRPFLLTGAYILVFLANGARIVLAILGVADHWFDFRKQAAADRGREKE